MKPNVLTARTDLRSSTRAMHSRVPVDPFLKLRQNMRGSDWPRGHLFADSLDLGWGSLQAVITQFSPLPEPTRGLDHPSALELTYLVSCPTNLTRKIEGGPQDSGLVEPREICLTPDRIVYWHHSDHPKVLSVFLDSSIYESAVEEIFDSDAPDAPLIPQFAIGDPLLEQLAMAIIAALQERTSERLYIDTVARMMAVHLARLYSSRSSTNRTMPNPAIRGQKLKRVIEYIETHLEMDLRLEILAAQAEISSIYFARAFKSALGQSPHQYVVSRRIERAKELLRNADMTLDQVAKSAGFCSQSHLCRWFIRYVGIPPRLYRRPL